MSKSELPSTADATYYDCTPCGYTARTDLAIGLCPRCGDGLSETSTLE